MLMPASPTRVRRRSLPLVQYHKLPYQVTTSPTRKKRMTLLAAIPGDLQTLSAVLVAARRRDEDGLQAVTGTRDEAAR